MTRKNVSKENLLKEVALSPPGFTWRQRGLICSLAPGHRAAQCKAEGPNPHEESTCQCPTLRGAPRAPHTKGRHQ